MPSLHRVRLWLSAVKALGRDLALRDSVLAIAPDLRLGQYVDIRGIDRLTLGHDVHIDSFVMLHCGGTGWGPAHARVSIGNRCYIGPGAVLFGAGGVTLEDDVLLSPGVIVASHEHTFASPPISTQPLRFAAVKICRGAWIGANACILPGVVIGEDAVVGAGAVVNRDVPRSEVVVGVPARRIRR